MQEELITDAAMQHHTLNEYINYWVRVSERRLADGRLQYRTSAVSIINRYHGTTFALGEVFDKKEEVK